MADEVRWHDEIKQARLNKVRFDANSLPSRLVPLIEADKQPKRSASVQYEADFIHLRTDHAFKVESAVIR